MNEAKIYSEKADKLFWYFKRNYGIFILSTLIEYRDTLNRYSKIQTKRYNEMKKHIDELEKEKE